jgi:hypothetical protein
MITGRSQQRVESFHGTYRPDRADKIKYLIAVSDAAGNISDPQEGQGVERASTSVLTT